LRDAGNFIAKLPKREHDSPAWRAATEALLLVAGMALMVASEPSRPVNEIQ
jgi:hypothetical protein